MIDQATASPDVLSAFGYIVTAFGGIIVILLGVIIAQTQKVRADLNAHILDMAQLMPTKVSINDCATTRHECVALNKKLIQDPLESQIADIKGKRKERWHTQAQENADLWNHLKNHTHTAIADTEKDNVIFKKK